MLNYQRQSAWRLYMISILITAGTQYLHQENNETVQGAAYKHLHVAIGLLD